MTLYIVMEEQTENRLPYVLKLFGLDLSRSKISEKKTAPNAVVTAHLNTT
jgi:hypothetical protein